MADSTETKTYIVDIQSNLDKYIKEADEARKRMEEMTVANLKVQGSEKATSEERERSNAMLRNAQKEYSNAKKSVDLATQANKAQVGSYEQLYRSWQMAQTQLKLMGNGLVQNADGTYKLTAAYIQQSKVVDNAKRGLDAFGKGIHDNRLNVGNYSEAIKGALGGMQQMPGALGQAAGGVTRLGTAFKVLLLNPVVLVITAIVGALSLLFKAFKGNEEVSEKFQGIMKGIGLIIKEVLGRVVSLGQAVGKLFRGDFAGAAESAKEALTGFTKSLVDAYQAGNEQQKLLNKIEDAEIAILEKIAKRNKEIAQIKKDSRNADELTDKELRKAEALEKANLDDMLIIQSDKVLLAEKELESTNKNQRTDEQRLKVAQEKAKLLDLETESLNKQTAIEKRRLAVAKELTAEQKKEDDEIKKDFKRWSDYWDAVDKKNDDEIKAAQDIFNAYWDKKDAIDKERGDRDILAGFEYQRKKVGVNVDALTQILDAEYGAALASVEYQRATTNEKLLIDQQYTDNLKKLSLLRMDQQAQELMLVADTLGSLSGLFTKQTILSKTLSISQALINTYLAGVKAMAELPVGSGPVLRFLTLASIIAAGMLQVKNIIAVKVPGSSEGGQSVSASAPTSISMSIPAVRTYAPLVGGSLLTSTPMSQSQLNALPNQNLLTAQDIANAIANLPHPIVSVEDINARIAAKNKVEVRAVI